MENQEDVVDGGEDFPEEFLCCVCLDLFYKPVVLACGHISCFWCVFKAMDTFQESYCPVCRHPYNYFPSICQLLHFVLLKLYPLAYKRRERQVTEEEQINGTFSPQFDNNLSESNSGKEVNILDGTSPHSITAPHTKVLLKSCSMEKGESLKDSSEVDMPDKHHITTSPATSSSVVSSNVDLREKGVSKNKLVRGCCKQVLITDLLCTLCKELLYRPVVLNCGHVYCEACIINPNNKLCQCPVCQSMHPNGFPKVCLVLEHFLEEQFPEEYAARKLCGGPSTRSTQAQEHAAQCSSTPTTTDQPGQLPGRGPSVHFGVGCDNCGMYPIFGNRYKCADCVEDIGFDLCEGCYNSSSKLPGRFNQQHTSAHKFSKIVDMRDAIITMLQAEHSEQDDENPENVFHLEFELPGDNQSDPEDGVPVPLYSSDDDPSENQQGTDSRA